MTGSTRLNNIASTVRAPYSAPQPTAASPLAPPRNFDSETGAALRLPAPFVPPEFRGSVRDDVTALPAAERVEDSNVRVTVPPFSEASISELFTEANIPASDFASFIEAHAPDESESGGAAELPWIEAFAADAPEPDETWPLDEAGKRLDELTQSLSSLDAARERIEAERLIAEAATPEVPVQMWNEEEWIDIMPTSPADIVPQEELRRSDADNGLAAHETVSGESASLANSVSMESAARALEGLAQRVRAGQVPVPIFPTELGQEAMLAGLLAAMLGWRQ